MSDDMEREKNERLTAREIEEEEMKRELTGIGIYEPGITYKQMKRLLEFVNESQDTSNIVSNNKIMQEETQHSDNECLSDVPSDVNMQQEVTLQECREIHDTRSLYSYKLNRTSPTMHERKTVHYINSPDSPSLFETRNPVYRRKSSDSDELFEKQYDSANFAPNQTNRYLSLRSGNISRECQNAAERRTAQNAQGEVVQKLEKWRLNPLDISINENDVPLRQPNRSLAQERMPFKHCKEVFMSDQCDQVIRSMSQHLKNMADLWYSWRPITNLIFQWGSPIQVGAANDSLAKKPLTDPKTEQITVECTYRDGHERASKRKANTLIANLNRDSSTEDEDGSRYDFVRVKKKKAQSNDKSSSVACILNQHAHVSHKKAPSNVITAHSFSDNIDTDIDNEPVKCSFKRIDEKDERILPELTAYPRRITPPNPKPRLNLTRQRRRNAVSKPSPKTRRTNENKGVEQTENQKKDNTMTEEEIRRELEKDWNDKEENVALEKDAEIRPLSISKKMRSKLRDKQLSLSKTAKETQAAAKEEESDEERNKKKRLKFCEQQKEKELCRIENRNGNWENQLLSDEKNKSFEMNQEFNAQNSKQSDNIPTSTKDVSCPICNKWFPHNEIEDHAADCEQFEANNEKESNDTDQLKCNICNNYKTINGVEYEEHVQQCINNRNDQRHSHGYEDTDTTSSSSFRNFIPISEQKDSEIDYLGQFGPSNSNKNVNTSRKRKC